MHKVAIWAAGVEVKNAARVYRRRRDGGRNVDVSGRLKRYNQSSCVLRGANERRRSHSCQSPPFAFRYQTTSRACSSMTGRMSPKNLQIVPLPHPHPVAEILSDYRNYEAPRRRPGSAESDILEEIILGVKEYFDSSLGRILLYRFERQQWLEVSERIMMSAGTAQHSARGVSGPDVLADGDMAGKAPSDIYGAEHLCRLFVSMPELIAQTNMDVQSVARSRRSLSR